MLGKICPYCKERIKKEAVVCRYCHKELKATSEQTSPQFYLLTGFLGLAAGAAIVFLFGYYKERAKWSD